MKWLCRFETVHKMVPDSMHKMLANIKKTQERVKRKKKAAKDEEAEESDEDEELMAKSKPERWVLLQQFVVFCQSSAAI